ncbi:hypothetical protein G6F57_010040 [Rhizopus arrhizus]|nr:hypothetical protein G6F24_009882 [Rhizopus arrhizus]KAG0932733.1 hypothetical protein G6F30_010607 [Rhizopus arrhizus]KAG0976507.1 hypothetical protein G6F29_010748 [Rhizopus arrhizus]KAG0985586.1 hypothetical protein G6F28_010459 [Rhizopus arrhizus]KAG1003495.1 hypothetical protein G6F27_011001 [Rhizopus arrhizus]
MTEFTPKYLRQTMLSFRFPESFVQPIGNLFFGNEVRVNVNGYFTDLVQQQCGLRQGFVQTASDDLPPDCVPSTLKVFAYADDMVVHTLSGLTFSQLKFLTQRRYLEGHLLQLVKTQCDIYSQRQLSIRGRATIANSLILSKIWYVQRLVHLPKDFFKRLRSILYQFVWRNCKPSIKYAQLCSPLQSGGLGLLDPLIQQHNLQIRWIEQLLADPLPHSCSQPYLLDHMRRFHSADSGSRLAMFFPSLRAPISALSNNFMVNIFAAMDSFGLDDLPSVTCNVATFLVLPLSSVLALTPEDYWTTRPRHSKLKVSQYFTFDSSFGCVRPQVSIDHPTTPRLAAQLLRDVQNRTVKLNNLIWPLILQQNQSSGVVHDTPFVDLFLSSR